MRNPASADNIAVLEHLALCQLVPVTRSLELA